MAKSATKLTPAKVLRLEMAVRISAQPRRVWSSLIRHTAKWWPEDFYSSPGKARMTIEPRIGGRMFEDRGRGTGALWGQVTEFHPESVLALTGHTASKFGGPNMWILRIEFEAAGNSTRLAMVNDVVGRIDARHARDLNAGWLLLFGAALKRHAEGTPA